MKKAIIIFVLILCVSLPLFPVQFLVSPPKIEADMSGKSLVTDSIIVMNRDTTNLTIKCYLKDWGYKNGKKFFVFPGSLKLSASKWITVNPLQFELLPYEKGVVRITVQKPESVDKFEHRSMIFFESIAKPTKYSRSFLFNARIGVPVYVETAPKSFDGYITSMNVENNSIKVTYVNSSANRLYLNGSYSIVSNVKNDTVKT
ncbi:MAG: hypothetical protein GWP03_07245, partial [Proteobacteria bacterium]|nr:hypothetical protein [Pseudomonadota bacterium]